MKPRHTPEITGFMFLPGGYTTINNPYVVDYPHDFDLEPWDYTWVAYDTPDATAHYTKTGAGTITANATYTRFDSTNPNSVFCIHSDLHKALRERGSDFENAIEGGLTRSQFIGTRD